MSKKTEKKAARKLFKFWFKVLLTTPHMNSEENRREYLDALDAIKPSKNPKN